jgi:5'-3' exonuclease
VKKENISQVCMNYLEALEWTLKYYTIGCPDWKWSYNYHYSPLLCDLIKYIPYFDNYFIKENNNKPIDAKVQLSYVLPKSSLHLLSEQTKNKLLREYGEIYKENWQFEWSYCKYFWESHTIMPQIDINKLEHIVNS